MSPRSRRRHRKFDKRHIVSTSSSGVPRWKQSPIDLDRHFTWTKKFPPLYMNGHWIRDGTALMTNTGKTVVIELFRETMPTIRGGPMQNDVYQLFNVQFRWGPSNSYGAEHSINKVWYSMEAQAMHWNTRYSSIDKCYQRTDGIVIMSYLMQVVGCPALEDNRLIGRITKHLSKIQMMGTSTELPSGKTKSILRGVKFKSYPWKNVFVDCLWWMMVEALQAPGYFTYPGSLTVPPYTECVTWIILPTAIRISSRQMDAFRSLHDIRSKNIVNNFRQQQPLHKRRILYSTPDAVA